MAEWLLYLTPALKTQSHLPKNSYVTYWGGFHITIGKTIETDAKLPIGLVQQLSALGKGNKRWRLTKGGKSRDMKLEKWNKEKIWVLTFNSSTISKALNFLKEKGWKRVEERCHITLGYTSEIPETQAKQIVDIILNKHTKWNWVAVQKKNAKGKIVWFHEEPAHDL